MATNSSILIISVWLAQELFGCVVILHFLCVKSLCGQHLRKKIPWYNSAFRTRICIYIKWLPWLYPKWMKYSNNSAPNAGFYKQLPRACCGAPGRGPYNFNLTAKCGEPGASACAGPKTHWSWDGIHLTEAAYGHIARGWLHGPFGDEPIVQSSWAHTVVHFCCTSRVYQNSTPNRSW